MAHYVIIDLMVDFLDKNHHLYFDNFNSIKSCSKTLNREAPMHVGILEVIVEGSQQISKEMFNKVNLRVGN